MRAYLYFTWETMEDPEGFALLKQAMLRDVSDHIHQLGYVGFLFFTDKDYERVSDAVREIKGRPFILMDVTEGVNTKRFKTTINIEDLKKRFRDERSSTLSVDPILDKILDRGYASLTSAERDYLDANSRDETKGC